MADEARKDDIAPTPEESKLRGEATRRALDQSVAMQAPVACVVYCQPPVRTINPTTVPA